ncbi:hypothetical protein F4781DRAFT_442624 [Annulohypoxylon bovei var. microspora]|nr:hypothetical protein F4781DRAFT_442624 [Annulohypoxylon bovei var. microspora]
MGLITSFLATFGPGAALLAAYTALRFIWPHARPHVSGHDELATRFLHATRGKPAWALVADAAAPVPREMCFELAARGFNVVLYGQGQGQGDGLGALRALLARRFPENKYRVVVADADADAGGRADGEDRFAARVARSLEDVNLTVVVDNLDTAGAALPAPLVAALMPLLRRNAPALVVNVVSPAVGTGVEPCSLCVANKAFSSGKYGDGDEVGVDLVFCHLGEVASGGQRISLLCPTPRGMARAVLAHAGCSGDSGRGARAVMYPYWPHGLLQGMREVLPKRAVDRVLVLVEGI